MTSFVLVAGAWHGAWCWERVTPLLEARGHRVIARDLPGTGADTTDPRHATLAAWAEFLAHLITAEAEPVILVGHSRGGVVISAAAELVPERVRRLVFVAGYLLPAGEYLAAAARADRASLIAPNMLPVRGGVTCALRPQSVRAALYHRCSEEDAAWAEARLTPEPLKPLATPLSVTAARFGRVPRAYVECGDDRAVTPAAQAAMRARSPCDPVFTLDCDHSPFLSQPEQLSVLLDRLGGL